MSGCENTILLEAPFVMATAKFKSVEGHMCIFHSFNIGASGLIAWQPYARAGARKTLVLSVWNHKTNGGLYAI